VIPLDTSKTYLEYRLTCDGWPLWIFLKGIDLGISLDTQIHQSLVQLGMEHVHEKIVQKGRQRTHDDI
jgi:hypothetical protein